ncbi:MAG: prenyltransferase/squalene oxidase repeat-containing protein [Thermofilum sp.]
MLRYNPFPIILETGSPVTILSLISKIDRASSSVGYACLKTIIGLQKENGAFPRDMKAENPGSVKATYGTIRVLNQCGVSSNSLLVRSALNWLMRQQAEDGGWHENPEVKLPEWIAWESTVRSVTWYTSQVAELLLELGMTRTEQFEKALLFLEGSERKEGGWGVFWQDPELDPDSTTGITAFLAQSRGEDHPAVRRGRIIFEAKLNELVQQVEREKTDCAYTLTHLLFDTPENKMYRKNDPRIQTLLKALVEAQRPDGGWSTFYSSDKPEPAMSAYAVSVLLAHRAVDKAVLRSMFDEKRMESLGFGLSS